MEQNKEYFVFISYSSLDNEWAIWLRHELEHYHLPASFNGRKDVRDNLRKVFRDRDELSAGPEWDEQVSRALAATNNLIVICSPNAAKSKAVNKEVKAFIALGKEDHIFPFIVEGDKPKDCFPPALKHSKLGGDVNKDGGRDSAFVKVVAGMLKVGFPSLWDRYEKEKAEEERKIREQRDKLLIMQSRFLAEKANDLVDKGDSYTARLLALEALPKDLENPDRPYVSVAEAVLRKADLCNDAILKGHAAINILTSFNPDGTKVASALLNGTIIIWDILSGQCLSLEGHTDIVKSALFSPDGTKVVSASDDMTIRIWDLQTGHQLIKIEGHTNGIWFAYYSSDGKRIISASKDKTVRIWNAETGQELKKHEGHIDSSRIAAYSLNGKKIVTVPWFWIDGSLLIWDIITGKSCLLEGHSDDVESTMFSPDGTRVVSSSKDKTVRIWDTETGCQLMKLEGHSDSVSLVTFSPDGKTIASASEDETIRVWDVITGQCLHIFKINIRYVNSMSFSPDGTEIAFSGFGDRTVHICNILTEKSCSLEGHTAYVTSVFFSPDGKRIISASEDKTVRIWDVETEKGIKVINDNTQDILSASFSPDGSKIVSASWDGTVQIWNFLTGQQCCSLEGHSLAVTSVSYSPDGKKIASTSEDRTIRIWDASTGKCLRVLAGHTGCVRFASFNPDGTKIASVSTDRTVRIWDILTGKRIQLLEREGCLNHEHIPHFIPPILKTTLTRLKFIHSVSFSPDGKRIVTATEFTICIWNLETGGQEKTLKGDFGEVTFVVFSPDGTKIATSSKDRIIRIWDVNTGLCILTLEGHTGSVISVTFSPDGTKIVSASEDDTIRIWDATIGQSLCIYKGYTGNVRFATFNPKGTLVASVQGWAIHIWAFPPLQDLIDKTRERFKNRQLTLEERKHYYVD